MQVCSNSINWAGNLFRLWAGKLFLPFAFISKIYSRWKEECTFHLTETALRIKPVCVRQSVHVGDASSLGAPETDFRSTTGGFSKRNKHVVFTRTLEPGPKTEQVFHNQISHFWQSFLSNFFPFYNKAALTVLKQCWNSMFLQTRDHFLHFPVVIVLGRFRHK